MKFKTLLFEAMYLSIAVTTFAHTAWAASTIFEGASPGTPFSFFDSWHRTGALMAISIDVGMLIVALFLTSTRNRAQTVVLSISFALLALSSFYFQVIYAMAHAEPVVAGSGVTPYWLEVLRPFVDARVVLVPALLPGFATIYTLASIQEKRSHEHKAIEPKFIDGVWTVADSNGKHIPLNEAERLRLPSGLEQRVRLLGSGDEPLGWTCLVCGFHRDTYKSAASRRAAIKTHMSRHHPEYAE